MSDLKQDAQEQFGKHAADYVNSPIHATGASLKRLVDLLSERRYHHLLDVATGGGHTALALREVAEHTTIGDVTHGMLSAAREHIGAAVVDSCQHDAEALPFAAGSFDLVTCRIAPHHFPDVGRFVHEVARMLTDGGTFALVDNIVSGTPKVGAWLNAFEKLRDPSHHMCYTIDDWTTFFFQAGLRVTHEEMLWKRIAFDAWVQRAGVSKVDETRLRVMLEQPPKAVAEWLQPEYSAGVWHFSIAEAVIIGQKSE